MLINAHYFFMNFINCQAMNTNPTPNNPTLYKLLNGIHKFLPYFTLNNL